MRIRVVFFFPGTEGTSCAECKLTITRYPDDEKEVIYHYPGDDPFYNELTAIANAKDMTENNLATPRIGRDAETFGTTTQRETQIDEEGRLPDHILSSYEDATKTYEFSWKIRLESEKKGS